MISYQFAYLIGDLMLGLVWLFLFIYRKDLRREQLITSVIFGICGLLSQILYLRDYWHPQILFGLQIGLEDFLFGFFIGGIATTIYKEIFHKFFYKKPNKSHHWIWFAPSFVLIGLAVLTFFILGLGINSIYSSLFMFGVLAFIILCLRKDLVLEAFASGISIMAIMTIFYILFLRIFPQIFERWWMLHNLSGLFLFNIPVEELWWSFAFGMMAGPMYEFFKGLRFKKIY